MNNIKAGTRIEFFGMSAMGGFSAVAPERATIVKWRDSINGPRSEWAGWHIVRFADGGKLCAHENRFRIVDNR